MAKSNMLGHRELDLGPDDEIPEDTPKEAFGDGVVSDATKKAIEAAKKAKIDLSSTLALNKSEQDSVATSSALLLMGQFTIFMLTLYVLNAADVNVRRIGWSTVHIVFSIFIAMLLFMSTKSMWIMAVGHKYDNSGASLAVSMGRFFVAWAVGPVILMKRGKDEETMEAYSSIIQWFTAFAGADAFGELLELDPFSSGKLACLGGVGLCIGAVWIACFTASWARYFVIMAASVELVDGVSAREQKERWGEAYQEGETVYAGFIVGLILSMWIRFMVSGSLPGPYGSPKGHSIDEIAWLSLWTAIALVVSSVVVVSAYFVSGPERSWAIRRVAAIAKSVTSMCSAWMVLATIEWTFWNKISNNSIGQASDMSAGMALALFNSVVMFIWILIIDAIADWVGGGFGRAIRGMVVSCQLIIGVSWQRLFYVTIKYSGRRFKHAERLVDIMLMWTICAIVLPAWFQFILPTVLDTRMEDPEYPDEPEQNDEKADEEIITKNAGDTPRGLPGLPNRDPSVLLTTPPGSAASARPPTPAAVKRASGIGASTGAPSPRPPVVAKADSPAVAKARTSVLAAARASVVTRAPGAAVPKAAVAAGASETDDDQEF
eukprot:CAMPEP_0197634718 /NCGR_PEP_ID=MMETSP1338-20131121/10734_1 /TAXON_ID=43686 ORGANISM="Pelagodinium beii, Strain RCC1491" /NCGR_SAMPLE_ID=MMETSP1338 /ASSEMBLY_ACC=CAM_ASM_000754 /LENGTH=603 /DNA_ID=CAMNT_0043206635 /DNA_START=524 /DNA_END=2335 /DNA_ORIENTATION=-